MLEKKVKEAIKTLLKSKGGYYHMSVPVGYGAPTVDFLVCYKGVFIAIEAKRPGAKVSTFRQQQILTAVAEAGGIAIVESDVECSALRNAIAFIDNMKAPHVLPRPSTERADLPFKSHF